MSDELASIAGISGGGAVGGALLVKLVDRFFKSDEKRLANIEAAVSQLGPVLSGVEVIKEQFRQFAAELARVDKRLEGVASNHGTRISALEIALAKWMGRQEGLETAVGFHAAGEDGRTGGDD